MRKIEKSVQRRAAFDWVSLPSFLLLRAPPFPLRTCSTSIEVVPAWQSISSAQLLLARGVNCWPRLEQQASVSQKAECLTEKPEEGRLLELSHPTAMPTKPTHEFFHRHSPQGCWVPPFHRQWLLNSSFDLRATQYSSKEFLRLAWDS